MRPSHHYAQYRTLVTPQMAALQSQHGGSPGYFSTVSFQFSPPSLYPFCCKIKIAGKLNVVKMRFSFFCPQTRGTYSCHYDGREGCFLPSPPALCLTLDSPSHWAVPLAGGVPVGGGTGCNSCGGWLPLGLYSVVRRVGVFGKTKTGIFFMFKNYLFWNSKFLNSVYLSKSF